MSKKTKKRTPMKNKPSAKNKGGAKPPYAAALGEIPIFANPADMPGFAGIPIAPIVPQTPQSPQPSQPHQSQPHQLQQPLPPDVRPDENIFVKAMRDLAVAAWKLKGIAFKPGTDEPAATLDAKQLADIGFYAERLHNLLGTLGVTMQDFTGQPFHAGMPVKVISAKPTPGLAEEVVFQTLTPTLKFERTGEFYPGNVITLKPGETEPPAAG
jgi:hypothetical protein